MYSANVQYFKRIVNSDYVLKWKSKALSLKIIKSPSAPSNFIDPS